MLIPIYGKDHVKSEKPFTARPEGKVWIVQGASPKPKDPREIVMGGTVMAEIDKMDGRVVAIYHLK